MDIDDKKIYIYKNINKINNHNDIINYIKINNIKHTLNDNGFFVNISYLDDNSIIYIYDILKYYINNYNNCQLFIDKRKELLKSNENIIKTIKIYNIPINNFNEIEQDIIRKSKKLNI
tara:strand:+ start:200 stop:553 length:354 start_codon:yes stop_codon:yes gene_type:complete